MGALQDFLQRYGAVLTAYVLLGCGIWLIGLIALPQALMLQKSLLYSDRAAVAEVSQIKAETDGLFVERGRLESDIRRLERELEAGAAGGAQAQQDGGTFNPFGQATEAGDRTPEEIEAEIAAARQRIEAIGAEIAENDALQAAAEARAVPRYGFENYTELFTNDANRPIFFKTLWSSMLVTFIALLVCYPVAFVLAKAAPKDTTALLMLALIVPYWVNEILRVFAWLMILSGNGVLNQALEGLGLIAEPIDWRAGNLSVLIGMVYAYILFMVFPIYNTIETLDSNQIEAARDLGAPVWRIHWRIVIPHAKPGIAVGCIMTFMLAAGSYAVPLMLGSTTSKWFTEIIYDQFYEGGDWGLGSAYAFVLLLTCILFILGMMRLFRVNLQDIAK